MERFSDFLEHFLEEQNISKRSLGKTIDVNPGFLHRIFSGERTMPISMFTAILNAYHFPVTCENRLREAFFREYFGEAQLERVLYIHRSLGALVVPKSSSFLPEQNQVFPKEPSQSINGILDLTEAIRFLLQSEFEQSAQPCIYTNYPFSSHEIDETVYVEMTNTACSPLLYHMVSFDQSNRSTSNLNTLFSSLRYLKLRQNIWYQYTGDSNTVGLLYPHYFISSRYVLLFSSERQAGIFLSGEETVQSNVMIVQKMLAECIPLAQFPDHILEFKEMAMQAAHCGLLFDISLYPCLGDFFEHPFLNVVGRPELPMREAMIQIVETHYNTIKKNAVHTHIHTQKGFRRLTQTGYIKEFPETFVTRIPVELRRHILERDLEKIKEESPRLYILDETKVGLPEDWCLEIYQDRVLFSGRLSNGPESYMGECLVTINNHQIAEDFQAYHAYLLHGGFACSAEFASSFLESLLSECQESELPVQGVD